MVAGQEPSQHVLALPVAVRVYQSYERRLANLRFNLMFDRYIKLVVVLVGAENRKAIRFLSSTGTNSYYGFVNWEPMLFL